MTQTHEQAEHAHPSNRTYVIVAAILGVITAVEVAVFYLDASRLYRALFIGPLVVAIAVMMAMFLLYGVFGA
jgi:hypothetical protein